MLALNLADSAALAMLEILVRAPMLQHHNLYIVTTGVIELGRALQGLLQPAKMLQYRCF